MEYKYKHKEWKSLEVRHLSGIKNADDFTLSFNEYIVRINGTVYTENTPVFSDAVLKEISWAKLND